MLIKDTKVSRISGPVGFSLIKPKKSIFNEFKQHGIHLPIMILFGDIHNSSENLCNSCTCGKKGCCMAVYEDKFLQLLDSIATPEFPIDFGVEMYLTSTDKKYLKDENIVKYQKETADGSPLSMLGQTILPCYIKELRGKDLYNKYCPTKNIRWQYIDSRKNRETYNLEYLVDSLEIIHYSDSLRQLVTGDNLTKVQIKDIVNNIMSKFPNKQLYYQSLMLKFLMASDPERAIDYYFEIATPKNSVVMKQFSKLHNSLRDINLWKKSLKESYSWLLKEGEKEVYGGSSRGLINMITTFRKDFYELLIKEDYDSLTIKLKDEMFRMGISMGMNAPTTLENGLFLDLYYIFRTFKIPSGSNNPYLSIIYVGDFHRIHISKLLTNVMKYYEVLEEINPVNSNRCINMPDIDINKLSQEYGVNINKKPVIKREKSINVAVESPKPKIQVKEVVASKDTTKKETNKIEECYNKHSLVELKNILVKNNVEGRSKLTNKTTICEALVKLKLV